MGGAPIRLNGRSIKRPFLYCIMRYPSFPFLFEMESPIMSLILYDLGTTSVGKLVVRVMMNHGMMDTTS